MQKDIKEGMSPNYREPYSYRQNRTETFDDMDKPSSALETRRGFDLLKTYDRARKEWPEMDRAPIAEDVAGNAANLSTGASIGNHVPENPLSVRTMQSNGLGDAKRGGMTDAWDNAYAALSETSEEIRSLIQMLSERAIGKNE